MRSAAAVIAAVVGLSGMGANAQLTATVVQPISSATFVNVYWDSAWDADNPGLSRETIDAATKAVIGSSFFKNLSEYGVSSVSFGGSVLPAVKCVQKAPAQPGFFVPSGPGISQFIQCEHDNIPSLQADGVIYNVILPMGSLESDFWVSSLCSSSNNATAFHYHGLPDASLIPLYVPFSGGPVYTVTMSNPTCYSGAEPGAFFEAMFHEMVEALTDPFPIDISIIPPHGRLTFSGEIADICEAGAAAPGGAGPIQAFSNAAGVSPNQAVAVPTYWSNARQACVAFADVTQPTISNGGGLVNFGPNVQMDIVGSGFDPFLSFMPMVTLNDNTDGWQAGNAIDVNSIGIGGLTSVSQGEIRAQGLTNLGTFPVTANSASLVLWVCNPGSLKCASTNITTPAPPKPPCPAGQVLMPSGQCLPGQPLTCSNGFVHSGPAGSCACLPPMYVDLHSGQCRQGPVCPSGEHYNQSDNKCEKTLRPPTP